MNQVADGGQTHREPTGDQRYGDFAHEDPSFGVILTDQVAQPRTKTRRGGALWPSHAKVGDESKQNNLCTTDVQCISTNTRSEFRSGA